MSEQLFLWPDEQSGDRLSWSLSKDKRLRDCLRKYYLQHYVSRGGSQPTASPMARETFVLKSLRNRHMWVGEVVHEMIELALIAMRRGDGAPVEALVERGTRRMRAQYAESVQRLYRERPATACGLCEHEYQEAIPREEWKRQRDRMEQCLRNLFAMPLLAEVQNTPVWRWLALESLASFELDHATVLVKPDFAWRDAADRVVMVDWKTGKPRPEDEKLQIAVYGLFAQRAWGLKSEQMLGKVAYLETGELHEFVVDRQALNEAEAVIRASLKQMRALHADGMEPKYRWQSFPMTDSRATCGFCMFRRLCERS